MGRSKKDFRYHQVDFDDDEEETEALDKELGPSNRKVLGPSKRCAKCLRGCFIIAFILATTTMIVIGGLYKSGVIFNTSLSTDGTKPVPDQNGSNTTTHKNLTLTGEDLTSKMNDTLEDNSSKEFSDENLDTSQETMTMKNKTANATVDDSGSLQSANVTSNVIMTTENQLASNSTNSGSTNATNATQSSQEVSEDKENSVDLKSDSDHQQAKLQVKQTGAAKSTFLVNNEIPCFLIKEFECKYF